jgi:Ca2+-binding RTX toxin-like protein
MSVTNITGIDIGPLVVNSAGDTYNLKKGATLVVGGDLSGSSDAAAIVENINNPAVNHNNTYNIDGRALGYMIGIYTGGANDKINIGATGQVVGMYGIAVAGKNTHVVNNGEILAGVEGYGIYGYHTNGTVIQNNGDISGNAGIYYDGEKGLITNGKDGVISASTVGIAVFDSSSAPAASSATGDGDAGSFARAAGVDTKVINHGTVIVTGDNAVAFTSQGTGVTLINDGLLKGAVVFGDGDDLFDNRGGTVKGSIIGGMGDDVLITDNAKYKLVEEVGGGHDIVKSSVSYTLTENVEKLVLFGKANINGTGSGGDEALYGNVGNNILKGLAGADDLFGGKGNDKLFGGADGDTFHFAKGNGHDTVMDFTQGVDKIDVAHWDGIDSFAHLKSHAHDQGANVIIENGQDSLLIMGLHKADLAAGDFSFPV